MIPRRRDTSLYRLRRRPTGAILARLARPAARLAAAAAVLSLTYSLGWHSANDQTLQALEIANAALAKCGGDRDRLGAMLRDSILRDGAYVVHLQAPSLTVLASYAEQAAAAIQRDAAAVPPVARLEN